MCRSIEESLRSLFRDKHVQSSLADAIANVTRLPGQSYGQAATQWTGFLQSISFYFLVFIDMAIALCSFSGTGIGNVPGVYLPPDGHFMVGGITSGNSLQKCCVLAAEYRHHPPHVFCVKDDTKGGLIVREPSGFLTFQIYKNLGSSVFSVSHTHMLN